MRGTKQIKSRSTWGGAKTRLVPEVWPVLTPTYSVPAGATIFTIGSCFARNVERNLHKLRFDIPTLGMSLPEGEWPQGDNSFLNRYTPQTIWQDITWTAEQLDAGFTPEACERYAIGLDDGRVIDTGFPAFVPVTRERFLERRRELFELNAVAFRAECVTITLGLVEAWRDRATGTYLHSTPLGRAMMALGERFVPEQTDYPEAFRYVDETVTTIRSRNPEVKILLTTSPVAMIRTFTDEDIITANMYSKSVLRAVAGRIAQLHRNTDYFPSYESAMLTRSWEIWDPDLMHLRKAFISKIVGHLVSYYFSGVDAAAVLHRRSYQQYLERDYDGAAESIHAALAQAPDDAELLRHAASVEQARRNHSRSVALLDRLLAIEPKPSNWVLMGLARNRDKDRDSAATAFRKCLEADAENPVARFQLARLLIQRKAWDEAERHLRAIVEGNPRHWATWLEYARVALHMGAHRVAIERGNRALEHMPPKHRDQARCVIGMSWLGLGDVAMARTYAGGDDGRVSPFLRPLQTAIGELGQAAHRG